MEKIRDFFGCGNIFMNKRYDNHHENLYRYCVRSLPELHTKIIPFFKKYPLQTYKQNDFFIFEKVIAKMIQKEHLVEEGRSTIFHFIASMNRKKERS